jgi:hypothetical protein
LDIAVKNLVTIKPAREFMKGLHVLVLKCKK